MPRINATINDDHAEQLDTIKQEADRDISDAEATRRIFDRARKAGECEEDLRSLREDYEQELSNREQAYEHALQDVREEHDQAVQELENRVQELRNQLQAANRRGEDFAELKNYVEEQRSITAYQGKRQRLVDQAGMLTRWKWRFTGIPVEENEVDG